MANSCGASTFTVAKAHTAHSVCFRIDHGTQPQLRTWRGYFLQGVVELAWLHFQALHHMRPQRERSDGVDPDSLGVISSFRAHGNEGLLPVSDECWMVPHRFVIRPFRMQSV